MKQTKRQMMIETYVAGKNASKEDNNGQIIVRFDSEYSNESCVAIWSFSRNVKPDYNYSFADEIEREDFIDNHKNRYNKEFEAKKAREEESLKESEKIQEGTILVASWGWEQTNIDFYKVISRKKDFITLVQISSNDDYDSFSMTGTKMPNPEVIVGEPFRKKIDKKYSQIKLESYKHACVWNGRSQSFSTYA